MSLADIVRRAFGESTADLSYREGMEAAMRVEMKLRALLEEHARYEVQLALGCGMAFDYGRAIGQMGKARNLTRKTLTALADRTKPGAPE